MHDLGWCLAIASVLLATNAAGAEKEDLACLPAPGGDLLRNYLLGEAAKAFEAHQKSRAQLDTPEKIAAAQRTLRTAWIAALGPMPERTPLNARTVGVLDRGAYRIEKVIYESRPLHHVTANLYVPTEGRPPWPGVLIPCGHDRNAKACPAYQTLAILLARHGFVVLLYDPIGQGERIQTFDDQGKAPVWGTTEHTLIDIGARLVGGCVAGYRVWDGVRSIDYLVSRPEVDPDRIGCTGNSGGGTLTAYLMTFDERIYAAAPSCYITSFERLFATIGPQDGEQNVPGQVARGIDHAEYLWLRAPKPTLVLTATHDFFDIGGSWASFREAKRLYGILGYGERLDLFEFPDKHGFSRPRREAALRWMRRWLQGIDALSCESDIQPNSDADLQVTTTGHVVRELRGRTVWDFNLDRAKELKAQRTAAWQSRSKAECLAEVRRLAGIRVLSAPPKATATGSLNRPAVRIEKLVIERPGEVPVPALLFAPRQRAERLPAILYVDGRGKAADSGPGGPIETLAAAGHAVLAIDVRGVGETAALKPSGYWHDEYPLAFLALHLNRPLLGQRVEDVLAALDVLAGRPEADPSAISIVGVGSCGPVALHAAALDQRIAEVTIQQSIESWMDVVATPQSKNQLGQVVPGALAAYDLPDLVRAIGPRPVHVRSPVDARGEPKATAKD